MMSRSLRYLAYGSNLHPLRLKERVPSATPAGTAELTGYRLQFNKRGEDGSAKCNLVPTGDDAHRVHAAVYEMPEEEKPALDRAESGYQETALSVSLGGENADVFTYIAGPGTIDDTLKPYDWYKAMVLLGVRYHRFPEDYLRQVEAVAAVLDRNPERRAQWKRLLARMMEARARRV